MYSSAKSSRIHKNEEQNYGPDFAYDGSLSSEKAQNFMSGGGSGVAQVSKGWIEIELTEPTKLTGLELTAMTYSHSSYPDGFLKNFVVRAGLTANSEPHNTGGDNLLTDKPLMLTYDEASFNNPPTNTDWKILDSEVAYLTFDYPTEAQYVLIQADWDSASIFSLQEVKFLKGKRFQRQQTVKL